MSGGCGGRSESSERGADSVDGVDDGVGPGPVVIETETSTVRGDPRSDVEHPVADGLGGRPAELADAADALRPAEQIVGSEAHVHPGLVVDEVIEGQVREAAGFGVADDIFGTCPLTLLEFERGNICAGLVGDERGVPEPFDRVEQAELRAGVWALSPGDQPSPFRLCRQVDEVGEFDDFSTVATSAVGGVPAAGRNHHDAVADAVIDVEPEAVFEVPVDAFFGEPMARSASICADQHSMGDLARVVANSVTSRPLGRQLVERIGEHGDVIDRRVRSGVARPQHAAQHLVGLGDDRQQRVMSVAAFVVRADVLLVRFRRDQRRVEVDDQIGACQGFCVRR